MFWKAPNRIVLAVLKDELEYAYKVASVAATQAAQAVGFVTPPVTPQSARRAWTAAQGDLLLHQKVDKLLDMATDRREEEQGLLRQVVARAKEILDAFKCPMCLTKLETGIVMSSCCGQVAGCKRCVERALLDDMDARCHLCRKRADSVFVVDPTGGRDCNYFTIFPCLDEIVKKAKEVKADAQQSLDRLPRSEA